MSANHYHKRYHSDALAGFMSLSLEERGAYQTLLDLIYDRAGPIDDNERLLAGYMQCSARKWRSVRDALIDKGKIYITDDGRISNDRAEKEIENSAKTSRKHAENGSKGGRTTREAGEKSNDNNGGHLAGLKPGSSHTRYQIPDTVTKVTGGEPPIDPVKMIFDQGIALLTAVGIKPAQARSLVGKWRKAKGDGWLVEAITDARARAISNPVEWIEARARADQRGPPATARASAANALQRYALLDAQRNQTQPD